MKQFTIFLFCLSLVSQSSIAQFCRPDSTLRDSSAGVYPKPITPTNPNGGINKKACINKPYEFTFTVVVPDTVQIPILPAPLPLEKVAIDTLNAIANLPKGIGYSCNPPNCVFKKNEFGCLLLHGTPTTDNLPGDFKPVIKLKLTVNVGVPFDYSTEYPGPAFPGEYILTVLDENNCATNNQNISIEPTFRNPNPNDDQQLYTQGQVESVRIINSQHIPVLELPKFGGQSIILEHLPDGMYIIHWTERKHIFHQKIIIANSR